MRTLIQEHYKVRHIWNFQNKELSGKNPAEEKANGKTLHNFPQNVKIFKKDNLRSLSRATGDFFREKSLPT